MLLHAVLWSTLSNLSIKKKECAYTIVDLNDLSELHSNWGGHALYWTTCVHFQALKCAVFGPLVLRLVLLYPLNTLSQTSEQHDNNKCVCQGINR